MLNEQTLVARAGDGDVDAFNQLVVEYQQLAYNVAYRILGNEDRAMDATQDAFLRGFRALNQYRGGSFKAWLLRIVTNCSYDVLRVRQRQPTIPIDDILEDDEHSMLVEDPSGGPEDRLEQIEFDAAMMKALQILPSDQRTVLVLSDVEGLSYEEIAEVTLVSLGTVKSRLSRARAKLREYLLVHREHLPSGFRLGSET